MPEEVKRRIAERHDAIRAEHRQVSGERRNPRLHRLPIPIEEVEVVRVRTWTHLTNVA